MCLREETHLLYAIIALIALYALFVGGRLKQAEAHIEIIRKALDRHLETGADYRNDNRLKVVR